MGRFQKMVLMIALGILVIFLLIIAAALIAGKANATWPPIEAACPDWWISDGSGNASKCVNAKNLGTCDEKTMNFNTSQYTGSNGTCNKYKWATKCKVSWDGITYGVPNPCST